MQLRDIVNRDIVNLENCESEPIHIPGSIQPHGFLLFLEAPDFTVSFCSSNVTAYCGITPQAMLGRSFNAVFGQQSADALAAYLNTPDFAAGNPIALVLGNERYSCAIRQQAGGWLIDAEPFPDGYLNPPDLYQQTRRFVSRLEQTQTMRELCQFVAEETRELTGYDRVMIYRFDQDYNGEVFAEAAAPELEPFLGLHYPHTDIPPQARALYMTHLLRIITDVQYQPVPILTADDGSNKNLDLSHSVLRSVSPIHIAYLKNMGVAATLTISLIHNQKLWGLIACHHYTPKNIPHYTRLTAQLQGHFLSSQIAVRQSAASFAASQQIAGSLEKILQEVSGMEATIMASLLQPPVLELAHATGVIIAFNGRQYTYGETPDKEAVTSLLPQLYDAAKDGVFITHALPHHFAGTEALAPLASGVIFHALGVGSQNYIIWFRKENKRLKTWAGDPTKAIIKDEKGLSPRKSFEQWQEIVSGRSLPWTEAELHAAATLAHSLQKHISYMVLQAQEKRNRQQSQALQQANNELEGINWISMHDLQEPLRKIQVFASRMLNREIDRPAGDDARRIFDNAQRMQALVSDIQTFARLGSQELQLETTDLNAILAQIVAESKEELEALQATLKLAPLPVIKAQPFLIRQLLGNLIRNSLRFAQPGRPLAIEVTCQHLRQHLPDFALPLPDGYYCITIQDNGIGFDNEHAEEMFGIFKRLHDKEHSSGTGMGLAICRKIAQLHGGYITAKGTPGAGSAFLIWLPAA